MDLASLLRCLGRNERNVYAVYRSGSHVYGTAGPRSDEDFVVILDAPGIRDDLVRHHKFNIIIRGRERFTVSLTQQNVFALECLFLPAHHILKPPARPFPYTLDRHLLAQSAVERSDADFDKAAKRFGDEPLPSRKRLFHALRVPAFALQATRFAKIVDYTAASPWWFMIRDDPATAWEDLCRTWGPVRDRLCKDLVQAST